MIAERPLLDRFMEKVNRVDSSCWEWLGATDNGYGIFNFKGRCRLAHRIAAEYIYEMDISGKEIDHMCHNRKCVRRDHLQVVPVGFNGDQGWRIGVPISAARRASAESCWRGHALDDSNTYLSGRHRLCRKCRAMAQRRYMEGKSK